jgi:Contractile injection system tube protein
MSTFPGSPRLTRGGIVLFDPASGTVQRVITLQYNPDTLTRSLQIKGTSGEGGDRSEALRLTGPPVETIKFDAEIDATDQLEFPDQNPNAAGLGIHPLLAALETIVYPTSAQIQQNISLAQSGTLEIAPMESPLALFVWSKNRILPVRLTEFSITEEAFDPALNPIRAKVSLGMRVLSVNDLMPTHKGFSLFMAYQQQKERLAAMNQGGGLSALGVSGIS